MTFNDISPTDLSSTYFPASTLTAIGLLNSMYIQVQGNDDNVTFFFDGKNYSDDINNNYFEFTNDGWISGVNSSAFGNIEPINTLIIPYGTAGICADALNINMQVNKALTSLEIIYIPKTVSAIGNYAFYNLNTVEHIVFENGINLTAIGQNAFKNMS